jgi:BON domain
MMLEFANHPSWARVFSGAAICALLCCAVAASAATKDTVGAGGFPLLTLKEIVVTGNKHGVSAADAELNKQVETAMKSDRYFYDYHVDVSTKDGVVVLRGVVYDDWDVRAAIRISRRVAGVRRVINQLEIGGQP